MTPQPADPGRLALGRGCRWRAPFQECQRCPIVTIRKSIVFFPFRTWLWVSRPPQPWGGASFVAWRGLAQARRLIRFRDGDGAERFMASELSSRCSIDSRLQRSPLRPISLRARFCQPIFFFFFGGLGAMGAALFSSFTPPWAHLRSRPKYRLDRNR